MSACRLMPALAASVIIAMRFSPNWNAFCSSRLAPSPRSSKWMVPLAPATGRWRRPVSSATCRGPPSLVMSSSRGFGGSSRAESRSRSRASRGAALRSPPSAAFSTSGSKTFASIRMATSCGAEAKEVAVSLVPSRSSRALVTDSPVDHMATTTASPLSLALSARATTCWTFAPTSNCRKNCCWQPQKCRMVSEGDSPHMLSLAFFALASRALALSSATSSW
mmetsp:Transcript_77997/g.220525  ORF Transcript_77997/g.220525 Transcript_77997/m.220525 type:complete len:222 (+) Transcript_77997:1032-1697(+)